MNRVFELIINGLNSHKNSMLRDFVSSDRLKKIEDYAHLKGMLSGIAISQSVVYFVEEKYNNGWIPVSERCPDNDRYILLSFENFSVLMIGRYEGDDNGGAFYIGDDTETCVHNGLFVNAWMELPPCYRRGDDKYERYSSI